MSDESSAVGGDFDMFKTLWTNINNACVPEPLPGQPAKAVFMMEMPGFSVDPDSFDLSRFDPENRMHPDRAVAMLADRVPALAPYFYDTGSHISFYWKQLIETFKLNWTPESDPELKAKYQDAIVNLYGSEEGYIKQEKTQLFKQLDFLRDEWQKAMRKEQQFWKDCQNERGWPQNFQTHAGPYIEKMNQAYTEYDNLKCQIEKFEAAIFQYTRGDLSRLLLQQAQALGQNTKYDAGEGGSGVPFYVTHLEPNDWWKWFLDPNDERLKVTEGDEDRDGRGSPDAEDEENRLDQPDQQDADRGWTEVFISHEESHKTSNETFTSISAQVEASYGGLFKASGGFSKENGSKHLTEKSKGLKINFKVRKVVINRPWLEVGILKYPTIGINGLKKGSWSSGDLDAIKNDGQFPVLPTAMIVAKDVIISAKSFDSDIQESFSKLKTNASFSVGVGCFSAGGNFSSEHGSKDSSSDFDTKENTLKIHGAQIIGWVCTPIPFFPSFDATDD